MIFYKHYLYTILTVFTLKISIFSCNLYTKINNMMDNFTVVDFDEFTTTSVSMFTNDSDSEPVKTRIRLGSNNVTHLDNVSTVHGPIVQFRNESSLRAIYDSKFNESGNTFVNNRENIDLISAILLENKLNECANIECAKKMSNEDDIVSNFEVNSKNDTDSIRKIYQNETDARSSRKIKFGTNINKIMHSKRNDLLKYRMGLINRSNNYKQSLKRIYENKKTRNNVMQIRNSYFGNSKSILRSRTSLGKIHVNPQQLSKRNKLKTSKNQNGLFGTEKPFVNFLSGSTVTEKLRKPEYAINQTNNNEKSERDHIFSRYVEIKEPCSGPSSKRYDLDTHDVHDNVLPINKCSVPEQSSLDDGNRRSDVSSIQFDTNDNLGSVLLQSIGNDEDLRNNSEIINKEGNITDRSFFGGGNRQKYGLPREKKGALKKVIDKLLYVFPFLKIFKSKTGPKYKEVFSKRPPFSPTYKVQYHPKYGTIYVPKDSPIVFSDYSSFGVGPLPHSLNSVPEILGSATPLLFSDSQQNVKTKIKGIPIPYHVEVEKKVPYLLKIPYDNPVPVHVPQPYGVPVEKIIPYPVRVEIPDPYPVTKIVKHPYNLYIENPVPVEIEQPYTLLKEKIKPYTVETIVHEPYLDPIYNNYPVALPYDKLVPHPVDGIHDEKLILENDAEASQHNTQQIENKPISNDLVASQSKHYYQTYPGHHQITPTASEKQFLNHHGNLKQYPHFDNQKNQIHNHFGDSKYISYGHLRHTHYPSDSKKPKYSQMGHHRIVNPNHIIFNSPYSSSTKSNHGIRQVANGINGIKFLNTIRKVKQDGVTKQSYLQGDNREKSKELHLQQSILLQNEILKENLRQTRNKLPNTPYLQNNIGVGSTRLPQFKPLGNNMNLAIVNGENEPFSLVPQPLNNDFIPTKSQNQIIDDHLKQVYKTNSGNVEIIKSEAYNYNLNDKEIGLSSYHNNFKAGDSEAGFSHLIENTDTEIPNNEDIKINQLKHEYRVLENLMKYIEEIKMNNTATETRMKQNHIGPQNLLTFSINDTGSYDKRKHYDDNTRNSGNSAIESAQKQDLISNQESLSNSIVSSDEIHSKSPSDSTKDVTESKHEKEYSKFLTNTIKKDYQKNSNTMLHQNNDFANETKFLNLPGPPSSNSNVRYKENMKYPVDNFKINNNISETYVQNSGEDPPYTRKYFYSTQLPMVQFNNTTTDPETNMELMTANMLFKNNKNEIIVKDEYNTLLKNAKDIHYVTTTEFTEHKKSLQKENDENIKHVYHEEDEKYLKPKKDINVTNQVSTSIINYGKLDDFLNHKNNVTNGGSAKYKRDGKEVMNDIIFDDIKKHFDLPLNEISTIDVSDTNQENTETNASFINIPKRIIPSPIVPNIVTETEPKKRGKIREGNLYDESNAILDIYPSIETTTNYVSNEEQKKRGSARRHSSKIVKNHHREENFLKGQIDFSENLEKVGIVKNETGSKYISDNGEQFEKSNEKVVTVETEIEAANDLKSSEKNTILKSSSLLEHQENKLNRTISEVNPTNKYIWLRNSSYLDVEPKPTRSIVREGDDVFSTKNVNETKKRRPLNEVENIVLRSKNVTNQIFESLPNVSENRGNIRSNSSPLSINSPTDLSSELLLLKADVKLNKTLSDKMRNKMNDLKKNKPLTPETNHNFQSILTSDAQNSTLSRGSVKTTQPNLDYVNLNTELEIESMFTTNKPTKNVKKEIDQNTKLSRNHTRGHTENNFQNDTLEINTNESQSANLDLKKSSLRNMRNRISNTTQTDTLDSTSLKNFKGWRATTTKEKKIANERDDNNVNRNETYFKNSYKRRTKNITSGSHNSEPERVTVRTVKQIERIKIKNNIKEKIESTSKKNTTSSSKIAGFYNHRNNSHLLERRLKHKERFLSATVTTSAPE